MSEKVMSHDGERELKPVKVPIHFCGLDEWSRELWKVSSGVMFVDVEGELHTMTPDWGEPCDPTGYQTPSH